MNTFKEKACNSYPKPVVQTVASHLDHVVEMVLHFFGNSNVVSVILTGSWARGSGRFRQKEGKTMILSDYDMVVVVKPRSLLRTTFLKRGVEQRLIETLSCMGLKSSVSIQVTTENRLRSWGPSFFSYDIKLHGITCFGRNIIGSLPNIRGRVPVEDVVLLLLNRLTEVIAGLVLIPPHITTEEYLQFSLSLVRKGYFSILQSVLGINNIQVYDDRVLNGINENQLSCLQEFYDDAKFQYRKLTVENVKDVKDFIIEWNTFLQCWYNVVHAILSNWSGDEKQKRNLNNLLLEYNVHNSENIAKRIMKILLRFLECRSLALNNFPNLLSLLIKGDMSLYLPITNFAFLKSPQFLVNKYLTEKSPRLETTSVEKSISTWVVAKGGHPPETIHPKVVC